MIAADNKLFAVTLEGNIYCFGTKKTKLITHAIPVDKVSEKDDWTKKASWILKQTGINKGYVLALGVGSGRLIEELAQQSQLHIIAIEPDKKKVRTLFDSWVAGVISLRDYEAKIKGWKYGEEKNIRK